MINYLEESSEFNNEIQKDLVLVDFFATWCGPCKMLNLILESYLQENKEFEILKVDIDKFPDIAKKYGIMSVPTLILFKHGQIERKEVGFKNLDQLKDMLKK